MKKNSGITLIALVITIIIMLIIATISVTMLSGDNSLIHNAGEAKESVEVKNEKDIIKLSVTATMNNNEFGELVAEELKTELESNYSDKIENIDISSDSVEVTFNSGRMYLVDTDGSIIQPTDRTGINVGDYVTYIPPQREEYSEYLTNTYTGVTEDQTTGPIDQTIGQEYNFWRVFKIYKDGSIDLKADTENTSNAKKVAFAGSKGYNNGVFLLNDICSYLYSDASHGITARSINLEDIKECLIEGNEGATVAESTGLKKLSKRISESVAGLTIGGNITAIDTTNNTVTYKNNTYYPLLYFKQSNESDKYYSIPTTETNISSAEKPESLTIKYTAYGVALSAADFNDYDNGNSTLYNMIKNNTYWLATRCTGSWVFNGSSTIAQFNILECNSGTINYTTKASGLYSSGNASGYTSSRICPIVHLNHSVNILPCSGENGTTNRHVVSVLSN